MTMMLRNEKVTLDPTSGSRRMTLSSPRMSRVTSQVPSIENGRKTELNAIAAAPPTATAATYRTTARDQPGGGPACRSVMDLR